MASDYSKLKFKCIDWVLERASEDVTNPLMKPKLFVAEIGQQY